MSWLLLYGLFALTTALTAVYELAHPVIQKRIEDSPKGVENIKLLYFVHLIIFIITAPLVLLPCLIPTWGAEFRISLYNALFEDQKI